MVSEVKVGDAVYPVACNAFTPIVFSREFYVERSNGSKRPKDINEDIVMILEVSSSSPVAPIMPLLEVFYACAKTADRKLASFDEWLGGFPADAFDLEREDGWASDVMGIVKENFFPHAAADVETATAEASDAADASGDVE